MLTDVWQKSEFGGSLNIQPRIKFCAELTV